MAFIADQVARGRRVESICRVLREQGCQVAARTYREWQRPSRPIADRTVTDAQVLNAVRDAAWTTGPDGQRKLAPEGLYGRRKMTAHLRRTALPQASPGAVNRAMRALGLAGVRRGKAARTTVPAKDGTRAGDLLDRNFTAPAPNRVWVADFERHEALSNRAVVRGHRGRSVAAGR
jgi:putative transposase